MTPAEVCARAAELIREHGWVQGRFGDNRSGYCIYGALNTAFTAKPRSCSLPAEVWNLLPIRSILSWNDDQSRTVDEVLAVLDEAAKP